MKSWVLVAVAVLVASVASAQTPGAKPRRQPLGSASAVFLVGGQWGTPTGLSGSVGFLFGPTFPAKAGADPTSGRKGLILVGTGGVGGLSIAVGGAALAREGRLLTTGFDGLLRVTRTTSNPTNATADATYAGVEAGLVLMGARLSAGVSHRIAGSSGSKDTIFTFGVGVQIPFGW